MWLLPQLSGEAEHVIERHLAVQGDPALVAVGARHEALAPAQQAHNRALELLGSRHLHAHHGLQDLPLAASKHCSNTRNITSLWIQHSTYRQPT